jgi:signal transduction histidine kinase
MLWRSLGERTADLAVAGQGLAHTPQRVGRVALPWEGTRFGRRYFFDVLFVVAAYYGSAHLGYAAGFAGPVASIVWLPVGVGAAILYLRGPALWPGVVIGDLLVNNYSALPIGSAIGQSFGNLLEVVVCAVLLRRVAARNRPLATVSSLTGVLAAIAAATAISATIGSLSLYLGRVVTLASVPHVWRTWWLGDLCGALIVLSLVLAWSPLPRRPWFRGHVPEVTLLLATLVGLSLVTIHAGRPLSYLAFPALIWAALRFGPRGATLAITISAAFTIWGTTHFVGPFAFHQLTRGVLETQLYLFVTALSALSVAALASEREQLARSMRASRTRIVVAADEERRRLERNIHDGAQQRLVALAAHLGLAAGETRDVPAAAASFEAAQAELLVAIEELRELAHGIHPTALRRFGLARAVEIVAARSATPVELVELPLQRLDETSEATAYYIVLEAVTNAQRYAHASLVRVRAHLRPRCLELEIEDDGIGGALERNDLGLQGLRDRVEATGGTFNFQSVQGQGTRIEAEIPVALVGGSASAPRREEARSSRMRDRSGPPAPAG